MTAVKLLAIGDVHLGTQPGSLPPELDVEPRLVGPEAALEAAVDVAIRQSVAAVVFAGDVVESTNARFVERCQAPLCRSMICRDQEYEYANPEEKSSGACLRTVSLQSGAWHPSIRIPIHMPRP